MVTRGREWWEGKLPPKCCLLPGRETRGIRVPMRPDSWEAPRLQGHVTAGRGSSSLLERKYQKTEAHSAQGQHILQSIHKDKLESSTAHLSLMN